MISDPPLIFVYNSDSAINLRGRDEHTSHSSWHTHTLNCSSEYPRIGKGIEPEDVLPSTEQGLVCGWTTGRQHWMCQTSSQASSPGLSWPRCGKQVEQARRSDGCFCCLLLPVGLVIQGAVVLRAFCSSCLTCLRTDPFIFSSEQVGPSVLLWVAWQSASDIHVGIRAKRPTSLTTDTTRVRRQRQTMQMGAVRHAQETPLSFDSRVDSKPREACTRKHEERPDQPPVPNPTGGKQWTGSGCHHECRHL